MRSRTGPLPSCEGKIPKDYRPSGREPKPRISRQKLPYSPPDATVEPTARVLRARVVGGAGAAYHLDAVDVLQQHVLRFPLHAREQLGVDAAAKQRDERADMDFLSRVPDGAATGMRRAPPLFAIRQAEVEEDKGRLLPHSRAWAARQRLRISPRARPAGGAAAAPSPALPRARRCARPLPERIPRRVS